MTPTELQAIAAETIAWSEPGVAASVQPTARTEGSAAQRPSSGSGGRTGAGGQRPDPKTLQAITSEVQSLLDDLDIRLSFRFAEKPRELVMQVVDRESGEVIRQVPPEDLLKLREKLTELRGVLFSGSA